MKFICEIKRVMQKKTYKPVGEESRPPKDPHAAPGEAHHPREARTGPPRRRFPPPPREPRQKIVVNLDTPIPALPDKKDTLPQPNWTSQYQPEFEAFYANIEKLKKEKGVIIKYINERSHGGEAGTNKYYEAKNQLRAVSDEKKRLFDQLKETQENAEKLKKALHEQRTATQKQREYLKYFSLEEIQDEKERLQNKIETSTLGVKEEQKIIQQQRDLEKMKVLIPEYEQASKKEKELKEKYDEARKLQDTTWQRLTVVKDEQLKLKQILEKYDHEWESTSEECKNEQIKIDAIALEISNIRKKMNEIVDRYYTDEDAYYAQQKIIKKIQYMIREHEHLVQRDADRKAYEAEELLRRPVHPHIDEMEACDQLMDFCKKYTAPVAGAPAPAKAEEQKVVSKELEDKLASGELKALPEKKKKGDEEVMRIGAAPKKVKKPKTKKDPDAGKVPIDMGILALFNSVGLQPPLKVTEVPAAVEKIKERKTYYFNLPEEEKKKAEELKKVEDSKTKKEEEEKKKEPEKEKAGPVPEVKPKEAEKPKEPAKSDKAGGKP